MQCLFLYYLTSRPFPLHKMSHNREGKAQFFPANVFKGHVAQYGARNINIAQHNTEQHKAVQT